MQTAPAEILHMIFHDIDDAMYYVCRSLCWNTYESLPVRRTADPCKTAVAHGYVNVLQWLISQGCKHSEQALLDAAGNSKHPEFLFWVYDQPLMQPYIRAIVGRNLYICFAEQSRIDLIHMHYDMLAQVSAGDLGAVDNIEAVRAMCEHGAVCDLNTMISAAKHGHLQLLQWLHRETRMYSSSVADQAAKSGHLKIIEWIYNSKLFVRNGIADSATESGNVELMQYLAQQGRYPSYNKYRTIVKHAIRTNNLPMLQWIKNRMNMDRMCCVYAAEAGNWEALQWLGTQGFALDRRSVLTIAAKFGHLEIFEMLHAKDVTKADVLLDPDHSETIVNQVIIKHDDCTPFLQYMYSHGYQFTSEHITLAAQHNHLPTIQWLRSHDCDWSARAVAAAWKSELYNLVLWLVSNGCPVTEHLQKIISVHSRIAAILQSRNVKNTECL